MKKKPKRTRWSTNRLHMQERMLDSQWMAVCRNNASATVDWQIGIATGYGGVHEFVSGTARTFQEAKKTAMIFWKQIKDLRQRAETKRSDT